MSGLTLVIGNKNYSSWSLRPWLLMRHAGIEFAERRVALSTPTTAAELAPYGSGQKVPVLIDADRVVWDSLAILEYVSEHYMDSSGWPRDAGLRALGRSVSAEMHSSFAALRSALPMNCRKSYASFPLNAAVRRDVERICALWEQCYARHAHRGEWLLGEFSIADAMYAPIALRFHTYGVAVPGVAARFVAQILEHPQVQDWRAAARAETEVIAEDEVTA
jgi:glutathione S-transferase